MNLLGMEGVLTPVDFRCWAEAVRAHHWWHNIVGLAWIVGVAQLLVGETGENGVRLRV